MPKQAQQLDEAAARYKYEIFLPRQKLLLTLAKKYYSLRVQQVPSFTSVVLVVCTDKFLFCTRGFSGLYRQVFFLSMGRHD